MSRLDAMTPRKRGEKTYWVKVGSAWPNKNGPGYQIVLDALPLPDAEGRCVINLFEPRQREGSTQETQAHQSDPARQDPLPGGGDIDDSIPFSPLRDLP